MQNQQNRNHNNRDQEDEKYVEDDSHLTKQEYRKKLIQKCCEYIRFGLMNKKHNFEDWIY